MIETEVAREYVVYCAPNELAEDPQEIVLVIGHRTCPWVRVLRTIDGKPEVDMDTANLYIQAHHLRGCMTPVPEPEVAA